MKLKLLIVAIAFLLLGGVGWLLSHPHQQASPASKLTAFYNATASDGSKITKVLRCLHGRDSKYLCATVVTTSNGLVGCAVFAVDTAKSKPTILGVQADVLACEFAS